jgi:hypothetical protein
MSDNSDSELSDSEDERLSVDNSDKEQDDDDLSDRMKALMSKDVKQHKAKSLERSDKKSVHSKYSKRSPEDDLLPPKLGDIAGGQYMPKKVVEDISRNMDTELDEEDQKRELLYNFEKLRKTYGNKSLIPEYTIHSDFKTMQKSYAHTLRQVHVDSNVESYRTYLIMGFYVVEFVMGSWLGFDMQDFTKTQIMSMNRYDQLLLELGEKSYSPTGSTWPVEVRLLFVIIIQTAIFIGTKMMAKKMMGGNLFEMMGAINNSQPRPQQANNEPARKMKGPSFEL